MKSNAPSSLSAQWTGLLPMLLFWALVMGGLYWMMDRWLQPSPARVGPQGELVIERARDGHFYVDGSVQGQPVRFLVDTGASLVMVDEALAQRAGLRGGQSVTFQTAAGPSPGRVLEASEVRVGPMRMAPVRVGVGLPESSNHPGGAPAPALLGQSFLSRLDILVQGHSMVLRARH